MAPKSDNWIRKQSLENGMIEPFEDRQIREGVVSFGVSAYGYDMRISNQFQIFKPKDDTILDPKNMPLDQFEKYEGETCLIEPHNFILCQSLEYFRIPRNIITITQGKSTYARCGLVVNVTPFEPEWEGYVTLSVTNTAPVPVKIYANEGLAQVVFFESDEDCEVSYADKKGKYQAQKKITHAKVEQS